jgi:TetR/AcrR family transcriptional regulator, transcriptional repressor of bet genes
VNPEPRFRRAQPADRRQALIEACATALADHGPEGASAREIARRAGISAGLISHYFAGIDELVAETYRHIGRTIGEALEIATERGETPIERLENFIAAHFEPPVLDRDLLSTWIAFWSLTRRNPAVHRIHAEVAAQYRAQLRDLLAATGTGKRLSANDAALSLTAMLDGLWLEHCLDPTSFQSEEAIDLVMRWIRLNEV